MNVRTTVDAIEGLCREMLEGPEREQLAKYAIASTLIRDLEELNRLRCKNGWGYVEEKLVSLRWHTETIAGLDDGNEHAGETHFVWALGDLHSIARNMCRN